MDPVQKAVISHTFGVPSPLKKKLFISCNICHLRFNSAVRRSSENRLGRGLGRERVVHWASRVFPGGRGGQQGHGLHFPSLGAEEALLVLDPSHPLLSPGSCTPSPVVPPGLHFPPCASPMFWILLQDRSSFPTLGPRSGAEFLKHLRVYRICSCPSP